MPQIDILLKAKADMAALSQVKSQLADFSNGIKAGFNLNIGSQAAGFLLSIPGKLKSLGGEAIQMADDIHKTALALGASGEAVQVLGALASRAGTDIDRVTKASASMTIALNDARDATSSQGQAFHTLGLDAAKMEGMPLERRLEAIAVAMAGAKDQTAAFSAASVILGARNLPALLSALRRLASEGYDGVAKSAEDAGLVMSDSTVERLEKAERAIKRFHKQLVIGTGEAISDVQMSAELWSDHKLALLGTLFQPDKRKALYEKTFPAEPKPVAPPSGPQVDASSVQLLIDRENVLSEAKSNRLRVERMIGEYEAQAAAVMADPDKKQDEKDAERIAIYKKQEAAISLKTDALKAEFRAQLALNGLLDKGFRPGSKNSPDEVAARDVTGLGAIPFDHLTAEQQKALNEKRARDANLWSINQEQNNTAREGQSVGNDITSINGGKMGSTQRAYDNRSSNADHFQSAGAGAKGGAMDFVTQIGTASDNVAEGITGTLNAALSSTGTMLYDLASGAMTFQQAWGSALLNVGQQFLKMATDMVARMIWRATIERALIAMGVTAHITGEAAKTASTEQGFVVRIALKIKEALAAVYHGAVEAFSALASVPYVGPVLGAAAMAAAIAGGIALVSQIGHKDGGYTASGAANEPAGIVHKGEWVAPKWMVEDPRFADTIGSLESIRRGMGRSSSRDNGYSWGGFVQSGWGRFLGSGGLGLTEFTKQGKNFSDKWNLFTGTQIYGRKPATESLVYDGKNWVNDMHTSAKGTAGSAGISSSSGSSSAGSSSSSASAAANGAPIIYIFADRNEGMRAWRRDPETRKYIVDVVNQMT